MFGQGETDSQIGFSTTGFSAVKQLIGFAKEGLRLRARIRNPGHRCRAFGGEIDGLCSTFL